MLCDATEETRLDWLSATFTTSLEPSKGSTTATLNCCYRLSGGVVGTYCSTYVLSGLQDWWGLGQSDLRALCQALGLQEPPVLLLGYCSISSGIWSARWTREAP